MNTHQNHLCPPLTVALAFGNTQAVIGAGAAGLVAARELRRKEGHEVVVFEQQDQLGGTWLYTDEVQYCWHWVLSYSETGGMPVAQLQHSVPLPSWHALCACLLLEIRLQQAPKYAAGLT